MTKEEKTTKNPILEKEVCGLVMSISATEGYSEQHWLDVREILYDAIREAGFEPNLVSDADDIGIIQKRIIHNLYANPIVVCDVSAKNPNVMFELGLRLAFDKPTIIVKDDKTSYSFDTSPIEHLTYPRDLRFNLITKFKKDLTSKIKGTAEKAKSDTTYTTFLKNFGKFTVAKLETTEISKEDFILEELAEMRRQLSRISKPLNRQDTTAYGPKHDHNPEQCIVEITKALNDLLLKMHDGDTFISNSSADAIAKQLDDEFLPNCFEASHSSCIRQLSEAIANVKSNNKDGIKRN